MLSYLSLQHVLCLWIHLHICSNILVAVEVSMSCFHALDPATMSVQLSQSARKRTDKKLFCFCWANFTHPRKEIGDTSFIAQNYYYMIIIDYMQWQIYTCRKINVGMQKQLKNGYLLKLVKGQLSFINFAAYLNPPLIWIIMNQ